jgi:hypothetical protein
MNNTKTLAAIAAILIAATLVVGGTFAALTATQSALAYSKKKVEGDKNSKNGNTVTIQKCKQDETASGFDNTGEQECGNTICTHPGTNASCVSENEGAVTRTSATSTSGPPAPIPVSNTVTCTVGIIGNCCIVINIENTTGTGTTTTGGAQSGISGAGACAVTITCTGGAGTPGGDVNCPQIPPTGTLVSTNAIAMKSSDEKCVTGTSGSLNTGNGRTFSVCVNV